MPIRRIRIPNAALGRKVQAKGGGCKYIVLLVQDAILGVFYGAAIGDSLGILTEFMKPSEAEFYYDEEREHFSISPPPPPSRLPVC